MSCHTGSGPVSAYAGGCANWALAHMNFCFCAFKVVHAILSKIVVPVHITVPERQNHSLSTLPKVGDPISNVSNVGIVPWKSEKFD